MDNGNINSALLDKIRKILARADEARNDNEHEREIAMRQANALLVRHGLSMADVGDVDIDGARAVDFGRLGKVEIEVGAGVWYAGIYHQMALLSGCQVIRSATRGSRKVYILGRELRAATVREMSRYLIMSIEREAARAGYRKSQFGTGAWHGIANQVRRILAEQAAGKIDGQQVAPGTALVVVDQYKNAMIEANRMLREEFPRARSSSHRSHDSEGLRAGRQYGERVSLSAQISGAGQRRIGRG